MEYKRVDSQYEPRRKSSYRMRSTDKWSQLIQSTTDEVNHEETLLQMYMKHNMTEEDMVIKFF
jgi:hypothetical protein